MSSVRYIVGDSLTVLRQMPDASVDLVLTSPPFLALRSYLPGDDPAKTLEMGAEPTPGEFIDHLLGVVEECRRVLAPHGSIAFELGDTYAGSGGAGGDYNAGGLRDGQHAFDGTAVKARRLGVVDSDRSRPARVGRPAARRDGAAVAAPRTATGPKAKNHRYNQPDGEPRTGIGRWSGERDGWPLDKSLCLVPELFRIALVYGFNPLTGRTTPMWRARNVVRWCRPNPPVGSLADKYRPATSDIVVACLNRKRYFDLDAVRVPAQTGTRVMWQSEAPNGSTDPGNTKRRRGEFQPNNPEGSPPLDWWNVPTQPYKGAHYATWPEDLLLRPILSMVPQRVCVTCGKPSERIVETARLKDGLPIPAEDLSIRHVGTGRTANSGGNWRYTTERADLGWTECGCGGTWRNGLVVDPFAGSGTTLAVAFGCGRDAIGIDLDRRNINLARQRVGMWLEVEGE